MDSVYLGRGEALRGESGSEFRSSLVVVLVFESKFMTVHDLRIDSLGVWDALERKFRI